MATYLREYWDYATSLFRPDKKIIYSYMANNLQDTVSTEMYNIGMQQFIPSQRSLYFYDANGNDTLCLIESWLWMSSVWQKSVMLQDHYDAQNNFVYTDMALWDPNTSIWMPEYRDTSYVLTTSPLVKRRMFKDWNAAQGDYIIKSCADLTLNANEQITMQVARTWNPVQNKWRIANGNDSNTYYYQTVNDINDISDNAPDVKVYPNPASSHININVADSKQSYILTVYDISGRLMMQQQLPKGREKVQLPVQHLSAGQYILSVKGGAGSTALPFVVK